MSRKSKKIGLETFIFGILKSLGDIEFQKKAWVEGNWDKWSVYSEVIMTFNGWCELILKESKEYGLTDAQTAHLRKLHEMIIAFDETMPEYPTVEEHKRILTNPKWQKIQQYAKQVF